MLLRFFHNPLLIAKLTWYEYLIKGNKKQSTAEYKIKRIIREITGENIEDIEVYNCGLSTPKLSRNGFQATAIFIPKYNELLVIFRGSEREDMSDWFYNYTGIVSGENTSQIESALNFMRFLKRKIANFDTCYKVGAGHSLGGNLVITVELLKGIFQRVYTYNSALPQLKQLRKYDKKFDKKLHDYFLEKDLEETNKLQSFTSSYYGKKAHHIYNFLRENDFIESLNMTVGTFKIGKTIKFPAIITKFVKPEQFLTEEDTYELDRFFGEFYRRVEEKELAPDLVKEKQKEILDEFMDFLISEIREPIQQQISNLTSWNSKDQDVEKVNVKKAYRTFKAFYNYMLYLAHSGIIPEDVIDNVEGKEANIMFENILNNETISNLKNILKPLQQFYILIRAIYTLSHAKGIDDIKGWAEIAEAHDLTAMYDVLKD